MGIYYRDADIRNSFSSRSKRKDLYWEFERFTYSCKGHGILKKIVCEAAGISWGTYRQWVRGGTPSEDSARKIQKFLARKSSFLDQHLKAPYSTALVERLRTKYQREGLKLDDLAHGIGCSAGAVCKWLSGKKKPDKFSLNMIEDYLNGKGENYAR